MTLISTTTLTGASITLSSIPQTYKHLQLVITNYLPATDATSLVCRPNNDTGTNYFYEATGSVVNQTFTDANISINRGADNAVSTNLSVVTFYDYTNATTWKLVDVKSAAVNATTNANFNSVSFTIEINVVEQVAQKPAITAHPLSQTIADGGRLSLSVQATGGGLRYQWMKNDKIIKGANLSTFTIAVASAVDSADYKVVVTNSVGSITSNIARIAISAAEIDVQQPAGSSLVSTTSKISFGTAKTTSTGIVRAFTIRNTGTAKLSGISFSKSGTHLGDFTVTQSNLREVAAGASASFTVTFKPAATGARTASIRIASNDRDENPFIINLAGEGVR
jgi:hypothetical protein